MRNRKLVQHFSFQTQCDLHSNFPFSIQNPLTRNIMMKNFIREKNFSCGILTGMGIKEPTKLPGFPFLILRLWERGKLNIACSFFLTFFIVVKFKIDELKIEQEYYIMKPIKRVVCNLPRLFADYGLQKNAFLLHGYCVFNYRFCKLYGSLEEWL